MTSCVHGVCSLCVRSLVHTVSAMLLDAPLRTLPDGVRRLAVPLLALNIRLVDSMQNQVCVSL
jgi:hypothetical protein